MATVREIKVKPGYEEIHTLALAKLDSMEEAVRKEIEERIAKDKNALLGIIAECEEEVEVEVPDGEVSVLDGEYADCAEVQAAPIY